MGHVVVKKEKSKKSKKLNILYMNENSDRARKPRDERRRRARKNLGWRTYYIYTSEEAAKKNKTPKHTFIASSSERAVQRAAVRMRKRSSAKKLIGSSVFVRRAGSKTVSVYMITNLYVCKRRWVYQSKDKKHRPPETDERNFRAKWRATVKFLDSFERDPFKRVRRRLTNASDAA